MTQSRLASSAHLAKRIIARIESATTEQRVAGEYWYADARQTVAAMSEMGGLTNRQVAGIVAALSPQTRWSKNMEGALRLVAAKKGKRALPKGVTLYETNAAKAWKIAKGAAPETTLGGAKVIPFFHNLCGDEGQVTVDTWIYKNAGMAGGLTEAKRRVIIRAYKVAAKRAGFTPAQAQAIDWVVVRGKAS